jgi:AcrR family transcriptional regulator
VVISKKRARSREDKADRRQDILTAAEQVWATSTFDALTMAEVARRAALAKGTLYLYFPTKETLLLALLESRLDLCLADVERRLGTAGPVADPETLADLMATSLLEDPALTRLLAIMGTILEHNTSAADIRRFKTWILQRMARAGGLIEQGAPFLRRGEGLQVLLHVQILVAGVGQLAHPAPTVARVLARPELELLRVDFATELRSMLAALLRGRVGAPPAPRAVPVSRGSSARRKT